MLEVDWEIKRNLIGIQHSYQCISLLPLELPPESVDPFSKSHIFGINLDRELSTSEEKNYDRTNENKTELFRYDFGSSTKLNLRIVSEREGLVNPKDAVRLLARNLAPEFKCSVCDAPATLIFGGAWGNGNTYCKKHAKQYEGEGLLLPIVNSPRVGVCGYDGPGRKYARALDD